jgi:hypothetical protein
MHMNLNNHHAVYIRCNQAIQFSVIAVNKHTFKDVHVNITFNILKEPSMYYLLLTQRDISAKSSYYILQ